MGWKTLKEHFQIGHAVQVTDKGICIGSPYIHDIIVVGHDGKVVKRYSGGANEDLARYQREFDSDPDLIRRLVEAPDEFPVSITVYTYGDGEIIEKQCEVLEWPNVTHDGKMMYENTFSTDKPTVVAWAKEDADYGLRHAEDAVREAERRLTECQERRAKAAADREKLEADYPPSLSPTH